MYPRLDFRTIIEDDSQLDTAWRSILREPLQEVLSYWKESGRPSHKKEIYVRGIREGISNHRWIHYQIDMIADYPEFYQAALDGLLILWNQLTIRILFEPDPSLTIDTKDGTQLDWSAQEKEQLLIAIRQQLSIELAINGDLKTVGIFPSRNAQEIYQRIYWLRSAIQKEKLS